jgi:hypothetical protein
MPHAVRIPTFFYFADELILSVYCSRRMHRATLPDRCYCIREFCAPSPSVKHNCNERFSCRSATFPSRASQPIAMHTSCFGAPTPRSTAVRLDSPRLCKKFHTLPAVAPISSGLHVSIVFPPDYALRVRSVINGSV